MGLLFFEKQLIDEGYLTREEMTDIDTELKKEINKATDEAEEMPEPTADTILDHVYAEK